MEKFHHRTVLPLLLLLLPLLPSPSNGFFVGAEGEEKRPETKKAERTRSFSSAVGCVSAAVERKVVTRGFCDGIDTHTHTEPHAASKHVAEGYFASTASPSLFFFRFDTGKQKTEEKRHQLEGGLGWVEGLQLLLLLLLPRHPASTSTPRFLGWIFMKKMSF